MISSNIKLWYLVNWLFFGIIWWIWNLFWTYSEM